MQLKDIFGSVLILILAFGCRSRSAQVPSPEHTTDIDWIHQVDSLLMPYWMSPEALGDPPGNFPNYRDDAGKVLSYADVDFARVPAEVAPFLIQQTDSLRRDYLRMKSRQVFAYGVAFHLTGHEAYLDRMRTGVRYLLDHGEYASGCPVTWWQNGQGLPDPARRNTQDLAYSLTGLAMYYYLTRDEAVLQAIQKVKTTILETYYHKSTLAETSRLVMWIREPFEGNSPEDKRLLAVLDQLNAWLVFLTPVVPDDLAGDYLRDMTALAYSLKDNFYDPEHNLFWMDLDQKTVGESTADFGHTIKSFWMLYLVGKIIGNPSLSDFARQHAAQLLDTAYLPDEGSWAELVKDSTLAISRKKMWWIYAELDQMAATLSLADTSFYTRYLAHTYPYWQDHLIDPVSGEVRIGLEDSGEPMDFGFKVFNWKNGFHSLEHALIGYLSTAQFHHDDIVLYYAFQNGWSPDPDKIRPYYFRGEIVDMSESRFADRTFNGLTKTRVVFRNVH